MRNSFTGTDQALWDITLRIIEGETVDLEQFSEAERDTIEKNLAVVHSLQDVAMDVVEPSQAAFNGMLAELADGEVEEQSQGWWSFLRGKRWAAFVPALAMLAIGVIVWRDQPTAPTIQVAEVSAEVLVVETLQNEIQKDFVDFYRDFEEFENLQENLFADLIDETSFLNNAL